MCRSDEIDTRASANSKAAVDEEHEDVLLIPPRLTKLSYDLLIRCQAVPRPWHLEGRWGSRTHRVDETSMGLPIISRKVILEQAQKYAELQGLLDVPEVSIVRKPHFPSKRAREQPPLDARIHPERQITPDTTINTHLAENGAPSSFTYAELFAGIGGFGVALEALGGTCVFCSELEPHCRTTYQANFHTKNLHGDIYEVTDEALPTANTLDLLVGGFPCQPFSALGDQPGFDCDKGRGFLFLQIVRVLKFSRPRAFLLENVQGLLGMTEAYAHIHAAFESAGYTVTAEVCSARGLTATNRKRLFFVGIRNDIDQKHDTPFQFPYVPDLQLRAEHILEYDNLPREELEILRLADTTMDQLLNSGRWRPASLAWPNRPCDTVTSHYGNAVGRGESQLVPGSAPQNPRRYSIRECARLMGFPNSYRFVAPRENQGAMAYRKEHYRMLGNAVCPPLIAALAGAVLDRCQPEQTRDWVIVGRVKALELAKAATCTPVKVPVGCTVQK